MNHEDTKETNAEEKKIGTLSLGRN